MRASALQDAMRRSRHTRDGVHDAPGRADAPNRWRTTVVASGTSRAMMEP
jgi:hypothetical protein